MLTYHFVMTLSLLIKILKIDKFGDVTPKGPKGASGGHKVSARCAAQASEETLIECAYSYTSHMMQENDDSSLCYDVIIMNQNF